MKKQSRKNKDSDRVYAIGFGPDSNLSKLLKKPLPPRTAGLVSLFIAACLLVLSAVPAFNLFHPKTQIDQTAVIKAEQTQTIKNSPAVAGGQPIKWSVLVSRSELKNNQYLLKLPKNARNIKVSSVSQQQAEAVVKQARLNQQSQLTIQERKQLASVSKPSSFFVAGLLSRFSRFFLSSAKDAIDQLVETLTQPEVIVTEDAKVVDLSEEIPESQISTSNEILNPEDERTTAKEEKQQQKEEAKEEKQEEKKAEKETPAEETRAVEEPEPVEESAGGQTSSQLESIAPVSDTGETPILETVSPSDQEAVAPMSDIPAGMSDITPTAPAEVVQVEYETPAPTITEQETDTGKIVTVSSNAGEIDCESLNPNKNDNPISLILKNTNSAAAGLLNGFAGVFKSIIKFFTADLEQAASNAVETIIEQIIPPVEEPAVMAEEPAQAEEPALTETPTAASTTDGSVVLPMPADDTAYQECLKQQTLLTDVLASASIPEIYKVGQEKMIKIKWKNNGDQEMEFRAYDLDNNGKLDYVEWTVPHLSDQIFEIIFLNPELTPTPGAKLLVKKTNAKTSEDFDKGDIVHAFNEKRLLKTYAETITNPKNFGFNQDNLREPGALLDTFLQNTKQYRFERISEKEVKRTDLKTQETTIISDTPNQDKEYMDVQLYINRRLKSNTHQIFGTKGAEYWYGGNDITTDEKLQTIWQEIETKTDYKQEDATAETLFGTNPDDYELVPVENFTDEKVGELESPLTDNTDPDNPKTLKQRKNKVDLDKVDNLKNNLKGNEKLKLKDIVMEKPAQLAEQDKSEIPSAKSETNSNIADNNPVSNHQKTPLLAMFSGVDPAGLAPASSGTNTDLLLHTTRAQVHNSIVKQKERLLQGTLFAVPDLSSWYTKLVSVNSYYSKLKDLVKPISSFFQKALSFIQNTYKHIVYFIRIKFVYAAGTVTTSIGTNNRTVDITAVSGAGPYTVTVADASTSKVGDALWDEHAVPRKYLISAIAGNDLTARDTEAVGGAPDASATSQAYVKRYYSTITLWEADLDDTGIYVASDDAVGEMYNDSVFDEAVTINGGGTVGLASITLTAPVGERHDGTAGTGARMVKTTAGGITLSTAIPQTVEWLEVDLNHTGGEITGIAISVDFAGLKTVRNNIVHGTPGGGSKGIKTNRSNVDILNNIIYDIYGTGGAGHAFGIYHENLTRDVRVINNTVHNIHYTGDKVTNCYYYTDDANLTLSNNIGTAALSDIGAEAVFAISSLVNVTANTNASDDSTAPDSVEAIEPIVAGVEYVSTVVGLEDLHLAPGAESIDAGTDLGVIPTGVNYDIDNRDRDALGDTWDIGADEFVPTAFVWDAGGDGTTWTDANNWDLDSSYPQDSGDIVIINTGSASITTPTNTTLGSLTLGASYTGTVTMEDSLTIDNASGADGNLTITNGTLQTDQAETSNITVDGTLLVDTNGTFVVRRSSTTGEGAGQTITAGTLTINGNMNADGQGFAGGSNTAGSGPGGGLYVSQKATGGGYGGVGGSHSETSVLNGGTTYGTAASPTALGSGGAAYGASAGGAGGGSIKLSVSGVLTVNGTLSADGGDSSGNYESGGGSGGSIWITGSGTLTGTGTISAAGGDGVGDGEDNVCGGGGGRIDISGVTIAGSTFFTGGGTLSVAGGSSNNGLGDLPGAAGTIKFPAGFDLVVDNSGATGLKNLTLGVNVESGSVDETLYNFNSVTIAANSTLTLSGNPQIVNGGSEGNEYGQGVTITATTMTVTGTLSANSQGFWGVASAAGFGPGGGVKNGTNDVSGGGYGGEGGDGSTMVGGTTYGTITSPTALGSGGGSGQVDSDSGRGGGGIKLSISGTLTVNGAISANGGDAAAPTYGAAGGSGGSIYLIVGTLAGSTGTITANGGNGAGDADRNTGGGGGGRIAIEYTTNNSSITPTAYGGAKNGTSGQNGAAGTVYMEAASQGSGNGTLTIDNSSQSTTANTLIAASAAVGDVVIQNSGNLEIADAAVTLTVSGSWTNSATQTLTNGAVLFDAASAKTITSGGDTFYNVTFNGANGTWTLQDTTSISGALTVTTGTINFNGKTITTTGNLTIGIAGQVTGTGLGGSTINVGGDLSLTGENGDLLDLVEDTTAWYLNVTGSANADYVNVAYSDASGGTAITQTNSTDSGNNTNWLFNMAPSISAGPSDSSSATTPTNVGSNTTFTATATDNESDNYYLAICKTDAVTAVNSGAPTCDGGNWCVSGSTSASSEASCTYTTQTGDAESNAWFAFVCDHNSGSLCSSSSQGTGDSGSPFKVNHVPAFSAISTSPDLVGLGSDITFSSTASDTDTDTSTDTVTLYVCKSNDFTGTVCGAGGTWCYSSASASDPSCTYTVLSTDTSGAKTYYGYVIDNHSFESTSNSRSSTFDTEIDTPVISGISPTQGVISQLPSSVSFTLNEAGYCRSSSSDLSYTDMTSANECSGGGATSITCSVSSSAPYTLNAHISCQDAYGNEHSASNNTSVSYHLPGGGSGGWVSFNPVVEIVQKVVEEVKQIPEKVVEQIKQTPQQIAEQLKRITELAKALLPEPREKQIAFPPIEESVTEEAPEVLLTPQKLVFIPSFEKFIFGPLPEEIRALAAKFPELQNTLKELGISTVAQAPQLRVSSFKLPVLAEIIPQLNQGIALSEVSKTEKQKIPADIVFVNMADSKIGLSINLSITDSGAPIQTIRAIQNQTIDLVVKPEHPSEAVRGFVIFKGRNNSVSSSAGPPGISFIPISALAASLTQPLEAKPEEVRQKPDLVLDAFDYTDPDQDGIYTAKIKAPAVDAEYEIRTMIDYKDRNIPQKTLSMLAVVDPEGYIYRKINNSEESRIKEAKVSLYWLNPETEKYELWPAEDFQQENPQITDSAGKYSFLVPEGTYYIKVEHSFYEWWQGEPFEVQQGAGVHTNIELKPKNWLVSIFSPAAFLIAAAVLLLAVIILVSAMLISSSIQRRNAIHRVK